ncbi:ficolin-1 [Hippoglossus hippoglossus]|uniref:ficolin-1 n=1 Tax=Hippoglossus hippoglossus TaxID=8267 RepID=UPI00148C9D1F|nr:ficolin-1 [Hippoglossus hippoglossus]
MHPRPAHNPPCRDSLVAAPMPPGMGAGVGSGACEGQTGDSRLSHGGFTSSHLRRSNGGRSTGTSPPRFSLSGGLSGTGQQVLTRGTGGTLNLAPTNSHGAMTTGVVKERLVQLQRCMHSLQETGGAWSHGGQESNSLGAILALMAAVLTECDLHCHSQALGVMAKRLESAAVGREGEKDLLLFLKSITQHPPTDGDGGRWLDGDPESAGRFAETQQGHGRQYREGFGSPQGEHWLGNAALTALTSVGQHQLRIELEDWHHQRRHATYNNFKVASEAQRYRLTAREYSGDAGNALSYSKRYNHDGRSFSTADRDHDRYAAGNCGQYYGTGWWFDACLAANLNGRYYRGRYSGVTNGIYWGTWYILTDGRTGERYSFKRVEMKTRPKNFVGRS